MKAHEYLEFFGRIYGMPGRLLQRRIDDLLSLLELSAHRNDRMAGFSKGMKQKVALARALLHEPAALFLDEPTAGLDPLSARAVRELILELKHASRSIILCTHDLDEAERLADQVAIVRKGKIVACDTPSSLRANSSDATTVNIELGMPCPDALRVLRALDGVSDPVLMSATSIRFTTPRPDVVNPRVVTQLVALHAQIIAVTCLTRSLEDVYVAAISADEPHDGSAARVGAVAVGADA
jgi:ABC-2 type transport system ATP-binding protein